MRRSTACPTADLRKLFASAGERDAKNERGCGGPGAVPTTEDGAGAGGTATLGATHIALRRFLARHSGDAA